MSGKINGLYIVYFNNCITVVTEISVNCWLKISINKYDSDILKHTEARYSYLYLQQRMTAAYLLKCVKLYSLSVNFAVAI